MPPSQAEIAQAFGFSGVRAAQYHLEALEAAGAIERMPGRARGIRVLQTPDVAAAATARCRPPMTTPCSCRCSGRSRRACRSAPTSAPTQMVLLDRAFFSPAPDYLLKVKGDSMRDEGIFDGDLIGVHRTARRALGPDRGRAHRRRDHGQAAEDRQGPHPPAAAQSRLRADRGACPTRTSPSKACIAAWCGRTGELAHDRFPCRSPSREFPTRASRRVR